MGSSLSARNRYCTICSHIAFYPELNRASSDTLVDPIISPFLSSLIEGGDIEALLPLQLKELEMIEILFIS
jgi:hypothetical protein